MIKANTNLKVVVIVSFLLMLLSVSISLINLSVSLQAKQTELKTRSLPLSVDNIYTEIQRKIIEPNLISSMMSNDTFVKDWVLHEEESHNKIQHYLHNIQKQYGLFLTFLVSEETQHYYSQEGFIEKLDPKKADNQWYFKFRNSKSNHEINLDYNEQFSHSMIMFINHKIHNANGKLLGAAGIGIKVAYIDKILKEFREQYHFSVFFINHDGKVVLRERDNNPISHIADSPGLNDIKEKIFASPTVVLEYSNNGERYLLNTQFIPELNTYLLVQAKLDDFTQEVRQTFYLNLSITLIMTALITLMILSTIRRYNRKLEFIAENDDTTNLRNRRSFDEHFVKLLAVSKRQDQPLSLIFFDVDNFKLINDQLGHQIGDDVLFRIGEILKQRFGKKYLFARWGGEEFIIALSNTNVSQAQQLSETLRNDLEQDATLKQLTNRQTTASLGVTECDKTDTLDSIFHRLDQAMYSAKHTGKNKTVVM